VSDGAAGMTKAQRLELAAAEAPILRNASEKTLARRVALVDKDGKVTGYTSGREVLKGLAKIQDLEHVVEDGVRPKTVVCTRCGKTVKVAPRNAIPKVCVRGCNLECATPGCKGTLTVATARRVALKGHDSMCHSCACRRGQMRLPPETRSDRSRRAAASLTVEHAAKRADRGRAAMSGLTDAQLKRGKDRARAAISAMSEIRLSERARLGRARMTPEQRSEILRKGNATRAARRGLPPIEDVARRALEMRRNGCTYREIADEIGGGSGRAYRLVLRAAAAAAKADPQ